MARGHAFVAKLGGHPLRQAKRSHRLRRHRRPAPRAGSDSAVGSSFESSKPEGFLDGGLHPRVVDPEGLQRVRIDVPRMLFVSTWDLGSDGRGGYAAVAHRPGGMSSPAAAQSYSRWHLHVPIWELTGADGVGLCS